MLFVVQNFSEDIALLFLSHFLVSDTLCSSFRVTAMTHILDTIEHQQVMSLTFLVWQRQQAFVRFLLMRTVIASTAYPIRSTVAPSVRRS
jgi:hypothetical protein